MAETTVSNFATYLQHFSSHVQLLLNAAGIKYFTSSSDHSEHFAAAIIVIVVVMEGRSLALHVTASLPASGTLVRFAHAWPSVPRQASAPYTWTHTNRRMRTFGGKHDGERYVYRV